MIIIAILNNAADKFIHFLVYFYCIKYELFSLTYTIVQFKGVFDMRDFFNADNILFRFLSLFCDLMLLNALFLISCIPIITIGPALTSLYYVALKLVRKQYPSIAADYIRTFKKHFKQSILLWIPILLALAFFITDLYVIYFKIPDTYEMFQIPVWIFLFVIISIIAYAFPLIGTYPDTTKSTVKNALLISFANLPTTIFIIVIHLLIIRFALTSSTQLIMVFSIILFVGYGFLGYFFSLFFDRIFTKIEKAHEQATDEVDAVESNDESDNTN